MDISGVPFFDRPLGRMRVVGRDEAGNPVYESALTGAAFQLGMGRNALAQIEAKRARDNALLAAAREGRPFDPLLERDNTNALAALSAVGEGLLQGVTAPGRALRGEPVTYGDAFATALDYGLLGAPMAAPEGALRSGAIRAYHGSPHDFDRFSMDKVGTGEGAQAYGHGLYFAESEDVARGYRDRLSAKGDFATLDALATLDGAGGDIQKAKSAMLSAAERLDIEANAQANPIRKNLASMQAENMRAVYKRLQAFEDGGRPGRMYEVQINANPEDFLDWDKPLSEQSDLFQRLKDHGVIDEKSPPSQISGQATPAALTKMPVERGSIEAAMREAGIPGIKYLDAGSRGAGDGSRNYVVFDENLIEIVRKYGIAGAAAMLGVTAAEVEAAMPAQSQQTGPDAVAAYLRQIGVE